MRYLLILLIFLAASPIIAADYHFELVDSVTFPVNAKYINHEIIDWDDNGISELLITFERSYYCHSFLNDSIYFNDSVTNYPCNVYSSAGARQYDENPGWELAITGLVGASNRLYIKYSDSDSAEFICVFEGTTDFINYPADLYLGDIDNDGDKEAVLSFLGLFADPYDWPRYLLEIEEGNLSAVNLSDSSIIWAKLQGGGLENAQYIDIDGDSDIEIASYGRYYFYQYIMIYGPPDYPKITEYSYQAFHLFDHNGESLINGHKCDVLNVLGGKINSLYPGDDIIVFKDGYFYDTMVFLPANTYGMYCLSYFDDSLQLAWAFDSYAEQNNLFYMPSIPNTFCASNNFGTFDLYDGNTGNKIGMIHGLNNRLVTEEGHFIETGVSAQQLIQINGNTVYLYALNAVTDVDNHLEIVLPSSHRLYQNRPNPFNPATIIDYSLARRARVKLEVYNLLGQKVKTLIDEPKRAGSYRVTWDGTDGDNNTVASGIYFYRLEAGDFAGTRKMVLLR